MTKITKYIFPLISIIGTISFADTFFTAIFRPNVMREYISFIGFFAHDFVANLIISSIVLCFVTAIAYFVRKLLRNRFFNDIKPFGFSLIFSGVSLLYILIAIHVNDALNEPFVSIIRIIVNLVILIGFAGLAWGILLMVKTLSRRKKQGVWKYAFVAISVFSLILVCVGYFVIHFQSPRIEYDATGKPNVLIITIDALRKDRLSCYSGNYVSTPNIDGFASKSLILDDFHTEAPWTIPSMFTMLTSSYPSVHGAIDFDTVGNANLVTFAELMRKNGYDTEAYIANNVLDDELGFSRGFEKYVMYKDIPELSFINKSTFYYAIQYIRMNANDEGYVDSTKWLNDILIRRLEKKRTNPFFIWAHYLDPHQPLTPPLEYVEGTPEQIESAIDYIERQQPFVEPEDSDSAIRLYDAESEYVDDIIIGIFDTIERQGYFDDTLIILTADHGEEHFEHGRYGHGENHYKYLMDIPCIIYYPGVKHSRSSVTTSIIDILPTVLSYVECDSEVELEGRDILGLLTKEEDDGERPVFYEGSDNSESVYLYPYTLIHWNMEILPYKNEYELVDNRKDRAPDDIVPEPDPELLNEYKTLLSEHIKKCEEKSEDIGDSTRINLDKNQEHNLRDLGYF